MLKVFRKKKRSTKESTTTDGDSSNSLWMYGAPPPSYSDGTFFPVDEDEGPTAPLEPYKIMVFDISSELEIVTKMDIKSTGVIFNILEEFLDVYDGSSVYRSIIIANAITLALHMNRKSRESGLYNYKSDMYYPVEFNVAHVYNDPDNHLSYSLSHRFKRGRQDIFLNFSIKMKKTKKSGIPFVKIYQNHMINGESPPFIDEAFKQLKINYHWEESELVFD